MYFKTNYRIISQEFKGLHTIQHDRKKDYKTFHVIMAVMKYLLKTPQAYTCDQKNFFFKNRVYIFGKAFIMS